MVAIRQLHCLPRQKAMVHLAKKERAKQEKILGKADNWSPTFIFYMQIHTHPRNLITFYLKCLKTYLSGALE